MKTFQIRTALCAIALLFTFAVNAENFSNPKNDPAACANFGGKKKKQTKKKHQGKSDRSKKNKSAPHCAAY